jgi:hypothetical protein
MIEERLLARNIGHFRQAQCTLFTTQWLQELFGYQGVNETVEKLLNGDQNIQSEIHLSPGGTTLLNVLSKKGSLPSINTTASLKTFITKLRNWSEQTSTSPSGRHLGHYKCLLVKDYHDYPDNDPDPGENIMKLYYQIATSALKWGASLDLWQMSTQNHIGTAYSMECARQRSTKRRSGGITPGTERNRHCQTKRNEVPLQHPYTYRPCYDG